MTADENLIDIETDKVVLELPAPAAGMLAKIIKDDGTTVTSGEIIATIDTEEPSLTAPKPAHDSLPPKPGRARHSGGQPAPALSPVTSEVPANDACRAKHGGTGKPGRAAKSARSRVAGGAAALLKRM